MIFHYVASLSICDYDIWDHYRAIDKHLKKKHLKILLIASLRVFVVIMEKIPRWFMREGIL